MSAVNVAAVRTVPRAADAIGLAVGVETRRDGAPDDRALEDIVLFPQFDALGIREDRARTCPVRHPHERSGIAIGKRP